MHSNQGSTSQHVPVAPVAGSAEKSGRLSRELLSYFVEIGCLAPTGDNIQHWKFTFDGRVLRLFEDSTRTGAAYSVNGEPYQISYGACIESIRIAASHYGFLCTSMIFPKGTDDPLIAELTFEASDVPEDELFRHVTKRCTNRNLYSRKSVPLEILEDVERLAQKSDNQRIVWLSTKEERKLLYRMSMLGDSLIWQHEGMHKSLQEWVRVGVPHELCRDGLSLKTLGMNPLEQLMVPVLLNWKIVSTISRFGLGGLLSGKCAQWMKFCGLFGVLTVKDQSPQSLVDAGRLMQRTWVALNAWELQVQPNTAFLFTLNHWRLNGGKSFSDKQKNVLKKIDDGMSSMLGSAHEMPFMCFRIGYATFPQYRALRRPIEEVLTFI